MKIAGIIAEYNPFHNGHQFQIDQLKQETGADYVVIAMSGNFLQRGVPAIVDKYTRTQMALAAGADLVLELPVLWATASAEYFAMAGITLFRRMGNVTHLCFGAESDNLTALTSIAEVLSKESKEYQKLLNLELKKGLSFPMARENALSQLLLEDTKFTLPAKQLKDILSSPNNILAIEYLKALALTQKDNSEIAPVLIQRQGDGYHETDLVSPLASATAVRKELFASGSLTNTASALPATSQKILSTYQKEWPLMDEDAISSILGYRLRMLASVGYQGYADCNEDISNKIRKNLNSYLGFSQFCELLKSKELTYTRISRVLLHILLDIRQEDYATGKCLDYIPYLRILGFRRDSSGLLSDLKKKASVPLITKVADASRILSPESYAFFQKDLLAADIYRQLIADRCHKLPKNDFQQELMILP